jgi:hypothetical protein
MQILDSLILLSNVHGHFDAISKHRLRAGLAMQETITAITFIGISEGVYLIEVLSVQDRGQ